MQTFLPVPDFGESARLLDYRRLGKQRLECSQMIKALEAGGGWSSHPAVHMWTGYVPALKLYMDAMVVEWKRRGYKNSYPMNYPEVIHDPEAIGDASLLESIGGMPMPPWLGDEEFHSSHRRALLLKNDYYDQFDWPEMSDQNWSADLAQTYWWPRFNVPADPGKSYALRRKGDY